MMSNTLLRLKRFLTSDYVPLIKQGKIGLEKEGLRVDRLGRIAQTPHPQRLGSPLTHPYITTDYSEALLELITPPSDSGQQAIDFLHELHRFVYQQLDDELMWNASMPCVVYGESSIPLARYGSSHAAEMKTVYRRGLGLRYGRIMQVIAGVHFNHSFSIPFWQRLQQQEGDRSSLQSFQVTHNFGLLRNLQRVGWMIPYLFGSSPAICKSFLDGGSRDLEEFDATTYYGPYATSLRMGDIGYQNNKENEIGVKACYDNLEEYLDTLHYAITTEYPGYRALGLKQDGRYLQLNANILQIENEYYSTVRPKQILEPDETPSMALAQRGVAYVELRSLDINPFSPVGIDLEQIHFLQLLFCYCLLRESPAISSWERAEIDKNEMRVAHYGRQPGLLLQRDGSEIGLQQWGEEVCDTLELISAALDQDELGTPYHDSLRRQQAIFADPQQAPSAQLLQQMQAAGEGFSLFTRHQTERWRQQIVGQGLTAQQQARQQLSVELSDTHRRAIEASDQGGFDAYLARYMARASVVPPINQG